MPKGDRLRLKADPEDGTTPVANLLLEAVAMAKISGLQKGIIIFLWRKTYGWIGEDGKRKKEAKITLGDWQKALDRDKSRIAKALVALEGMNIIHRRVVDIWGGYHYKLNTNIASWNSDSINLAKLSETVTVAHLPTVGENATVDLNDHSGGKGNSSPKQHATVGENATPQLTKTPLPTLYKENIKKDKEKGAIKKSPYGDDTAKVFKMLDTERGYRPTQKRKAEAASIIRMLKAKYTPEQIMNVYQEMKAEPFWARKELYMMSVESQIGAKVKSGAHQRNPRQVPRPEDYPTPDEARRAGK